MLESDGLDDESLKDHENLFLENPQRGDVIEGTDGARKIRIQLSDNRGKSGGDRVIYIDVFEKEMVNVAETRKYLHMSQKVFTSVLNVSTRKSEVLDTG